MFDFTPFRCVDGSIDMLMLLRDRYPGGPHSDIVKLIVNIEKIHSIESRETAAVLIGMADCMMED